MKSNETKRFISFVLTVVMLLGMVPTTTGVVYGADDVPDADYYLKVGQTVTIDGGGSILGSNHTWISEKPSVVSVSGSGSNATITGKTVGELVTITHTYRQSYIFGSSNESESWTVLVVEEYPEGAYTTYPIYFFLAKPGETPTANSTYAPLPGHDQGSVFGTQKATVELVGPNIEYRNVNDEDIVKRYIDLSPSELEAVENFGIQEFSFGDGTTATYNSDEYDLIWNTICVRNGCHGSGTHFHVDAVLSKRIQPAALKLEKTIPDAFDDRTITFQFQLEKLLQDENYDPTEEVDPLFTPLQLKAEIQAGNTSAAITGIGDQKLTFGYYKLTENLSPEDSVMWNADVWYIQINTDGTLRFGKSYNGTYTTAEIVPVNNSYQVYSVRYTDGVPGEEIFKDQEYTGLKYTDGHPEFLVDGQPGEPFRSGYTFEGWKTSAEGKTAIYTATWKVIPGTLKVEKQFVGAVDVPEDFKITVTGADGVTRTLALDDPGVEKEVSGDTMIYTWTIGDVIPGSYQAVESGYDIYGHTNQDGPSVRYYPGTVVSNSTETLYLYNAYEVNEYTVTWNDGTQNLYTESVEYLTVPKYNQASYGAITAVGKVQTGWTDGITSEIFGVNEPLPAVTKNVTFTAVFTPVYTITYKDGLGGSLFADQVHHNVLKGSKTPAFDGDGDSIIPARQGYTFTGWSPELSETVNGSDTYHATWKADPSTEYRVEHYKMNIDGTWPTSPSETVTLTGITDTTAVAEAKNYNGYQVVSHNNTVTSGTITAGEPLVLKLYYTKVFTLTFVDYDGSKEFVNNVPYGTSVASITSTKNPGDHTDPDYKYTFVGWDQTDPVDDETNVKSDMTFNAQYSATPILRKGTIYTYMDDNLMDLDARYKYSSVYVSTSSSITSDTALIPTTKSAVGTYTVDLPSGNYYVYLKEISGDYYQVPNRILAIGQNITSVVRLDRYSVQYQDISVRNDHTTTTSILSTEYYFKGDQVLVSKMVPTKAGFVFDGWKDQYGTVYRPSTDNYSSLLSSSIEKRHLLTAQWKDAKKVNVVVTVDHMSKSSPAAINPSIGGTLQIHLTEKGSSGLYGDVSGKIVTVTVEDTNATTVTYDGIAFEELSAAVEHSARAELLGYTVVNVTKSAVSESEETVYIVLQYDPAGFELEFDVEFVHHKGTDINDADPRLVPEAIDVKIFYWDETKQWVLLEEAGGTGAGSVEVTNSSTDPAIWKGTGRYHVWGIKDLNTNPATPYYYRVEVVGVDLIDDNYLYFDNDGKTTANGIFPGSAFTAGGIQTGLNPGDKGLHGNISGSSITGQVGKLTLTVKGFPYDVTFDPAGGVWSDSTTDAKTVKDRFTIPNLAEYVPTSDGALFRGWYTADDRLVQTSDHIYQYVTTPGGTLELHAKWAQERTINGEIYINNYYQLGDTIHYLYEFGRPTEVELHIHKVSNKNLVASKTLEIPQGAWNTSGVALNYAISGLPNDGSEYYVEAELKNYVTTYQNVYGGAFLTTSNKAIFTDVEDTEATVNAKLTFQEESFGLHYVVTGPGLGENFSLTVGAVVKSALQVGNSIDQWPIITQQLPGGVVTPDRVTVSAVHSGTGTYPVWKYHPNGETWLYAIRVWDYTANVNGVLDTVTYDAVDAPFTATYTPNYDWVDGAPQYLTAILTPKTYKINYELDGGTKGAGTPENHVWSHNTPVPEPTRVGYTFLGWTVTPELGIAEGKEVTIPAHVAKEVTLTANWAVDNNGDGTPDAQQVFIDYLTTSGGGVSTNAAIVTVSSGAAVVTAEAVTATADTGYTFTGWTLTSGEAAGVTFGAMNPVIQPVFNTNAFGKAYVFTANFAVDKNEDGTPDAQQIFVEYRATSGGSVTIAEEAVTVSGVTVGALGSNAVTTTGIAFDGWVLTSGEDANVSFDGEKATLKPVFKAEAAGETYVFTAVFASDENNDSVPDQYQKQITFRVTNGAWAVTGGGGVDRADKTYTVTLKNPYTGKPAEDGRANISALIPDLSGVVADAGFTTEPTTFWSPAYPSSMYVNGTEPAVYVLNFLTTVEYDDHDAKDMVKVLMPNGGKIQIDPNGGTWSESSDKQSVVVEVVSGTAYVLTPEAVRADHVFDGWTISEANDGEHIYVFTAQWIHRASLYYPVSVEIKLDDVLTTAGGVHPGSTGFYLMKTKDDPTKYPLELSSSGIYVGEVRPGDYNLYREEGVEGHKVGNYIMIVDFDGGELTIDHYSVSYDTNEGSGVSVPRTDIYFYGTDVQVIEEVPTRAGYRFLGWQYNDDTSKYWKAGETFSGPNGIVTKAAFTAQWEDLINVKVNFTINFGEDDAANRNQVLFLLMNNIDGAMAPVGVKTTLDPNSANGLGYDWSYFTGTGDTTTSTSEAVGIKFVSRDYNYKDLVRGTYLINCAKNSYDVTVTSSATTSGDITIDVTLDFNPNDFNLRFTADVDSTIPNTLVPKNVNVKVLCWTDGQWKVINQQDSSAVPPVSVAISTDTRTGTGNYPVWISDHTTTNGAATEPFYYRVMVTGFVYPDGTVRPATAVSAGELYTDGNYTASVQVTGGYDNISGTALTGAYYSSTAGISGQTGTINVHVTAETYDVTFDATGGAINGAAKYTVIEQYVVPTLSAFVPVRDNYIFRGWYTDPALTQTMASGTPLTENTTFYAKWEPIQAIAGTVYVDGLYDHAGTQTEVRSTCLPTRITVYLQKNDGKYAENISSQAVSVDWNTVVPNHGIATYEFTGLDALVAADYQIFIEETNYTSSYVNAASVSAGAFTPGNNKAVFNADPTNTYVNALLHFTPDTFDQVVRVDASQIGDGYRPETVRAQFQYKEQNTTNNYHVINEHTVFPYGVNVSLTSGAVGEATQTGLWKRSWHLNNPYDYIAVLTKIGDVDYNAETFPFTVSYGNAVYWNGAGSTGPLTMTLTPKTYDIIYDYGDSETVSTGAHTWSFETALSTEVPTRTGLVFMGWYDNEDLQGEPVTSIHASVAETSRVYAKWETDTLQENPDQTIGDGIPDIYQCVVQFRIIGGTWGDKGGSAPIGHVYTLKEKNAAGQWVDKDTRLGNRIPTNMKCVDENTTQGSWNVDINSETPVTGPRTYTYTYTHSVTLIVQNGTVSTTGGQIYTNTTVTLPVDHNAAASELCEFQFAPQSGYVLKSVTVDNVPTTAGFNASGSGIVKVNQQQSHRIVVIYDVDVNRDGIADSFQKKVIFQVVNGSWNEQGNPTLISRYVTLTTDGGIAAEDGIATISAIVPTATPAAGYKGGRWDVNPADHGYTVSGTDDITYTYRYQKINYLDYHYAIHHELQQPSGNYAEDTGSMVQRMIQIELTLEGNGFESGKVPTLTVEPSDYKDYGSHYHVNTAASITTAAPVYRATGNTAQTAHRLTIRYDLDEHTLTYDANGGSTVDNVTTRCGLEIDLAAAPTKAGHVFAGWLVTSGTAVGTTYQAGDGFEFTQETVMTAQWVDDVNNDGIPDAQQIFVTYRATTGGAVSSTGEAVTVSGETAIAAGTTATTTGSFAFDGWVLTSGAAVNVTFDREKTLLKPEFTKLAAGETYVFTAVFADDSDNDGIADKYQKDIVFRVTNGAWSTSDDTANIRHTVTLMKDGKPSLDGTADITSLIPDKSLAVANAGYITTTAPFWSPELPNNGIVSGTGEEAFTLNFYTTVIYDDYATTEAGIVPIRPGEKILVDPEGGSWNGFTADQEVIVNVDGGEAYTLTPEAIRNEHVFNGWKCEAGTDGIHTYVFKAQWIHKKDLTYPVTVTGKLDNEVVTVGALHEGSTGIRLVLDTDANKKYNLTETTSGAYTGTVPPGAYRIYRMEGDSEHRVGDFLLTVTYEGGSLEINHYSVNYDLAGGTALSLKMQEVYFRGTGDIRVTNIVPSRAGFEFMGWENSVDGQIYQPGSVLTNGITTKTTLTAVWKELIDIKVNVIVNYGEDTASNRDEVTFQLMSILNNTRAMMPVKDPVTLTTEGAATTYDAVEITSGGSVIGVSYGGFTYKDLPQGSYTINCVKSGYNVSISAISTAELTQDTTFTIILTFEPNDFDLNFKVDVDDSIPDELVPKHVNVKVTCWDSEEGVWKIINQQDGVGSSPYVVNIQKDGSNNDTGEGSYPVWMMDHRIGSGDDVPFYYRVMVTGFGYPDALGTVKTAQGTIPDVQYTDGNYTATIVVSDGAIVSGGALAGAYYTTAGGAGLQQGTITVKVKAETYDVVFNGNGGTVTGSALTSGAVVTMSAQHFVPDLTSITAIRDNYVFRGWYTDPGFTKTIESGAVLVTDVALYAKWEPIQEISGTIEVDGLYDHGGHQTPVRETCRPSKVRVTLERYDGVLHPIQFTDVNVTWSGNVGSASYEFTSLAALNSGHYYQISINEINYTTEYSNADHDGFFSTNAAFQKAVFLTTPTATYVNAKLHFTPDSFAQKVQVDVTSIGAAFRPGDVKVQYLYTRQGTSSQNVISEHSVTPHGLAVDMNTASGIGSATQPGLWKRAWNSDYNTVVLYDYQAELLKVGGVDYEPAFAPYTVSYGEPVYWNKDISNSSGVLTVKLTPKNYNIQYVLDGGELASGSPTKHTWSHDTNVPAATRDGYIFLGWTADHAEVTSGTSVTIPGSVAQNVTLTAHWTLDTNKDGTPDDQQVFIKYQAGSNGTVTVTSEAITLSGITTSAVGSTANAGGGFAFDGWTLSTSGPTGAVTYIAENPAIAPSFTEAAAGHTYTFTANFAVSANGDNVPDYKQGFIVFTADANGKVEGTTKQAFTLTKGALGYTGKVTPEVVTAKAITSGYAFDFWTIDGTTPVDPFVEQTLEGGTTVTYTAKFAVDGNNDGKPDKYQKLVTFKVINGTWNLTGNPTSTAFYADLDEFGKADITSKVPYPTANPNFTNSVWDNSPYSNERNTSVIVSGTDPVTYTLRYTAYTYQYNIEHYKQDTNGGYSLDATTTGTGVATINAENTGFVTGHALSVGSYDHKDYGSHYSVVRTTTGAPVYTPGVGVITPPALRVYYDLDQHTLTYVHGNGVSNEVITTRHGITLTVKDAPTRAGFVFKGWEASGGLTGTFTTGQTIVLTDNVVLTAIWKEDVNGDGTPDEDQKVITFLVENGTWNSTGNSDPIVLYVTLSGGIADITDRIPTASAIEHCTGGAWNTTLNGTVSGTAPAIYTYRFGSYIYDYTIRHEKQKLDGIYELVETETKSEVIQLNNTNNGFANVPIIEVTSYRDFGEHYLVDVTSSAIKATAIYGQPLTLVVKYALDDHTLTYVHENGTSDEAITVRHGSTLIVKAPTRSGYTFQHWIATTAAGVETTTYAALSNITLNENTTLTAVWTLIPVTPGGGGGGGQENPEDKIPDEFTKDHNAFVSGYTDGTIRPEGKITRAEVAAIFYNLLTDEIRAQYTKDVYSRSFSDVSEGKWFYTAVSAMAEMGVINGYPDGTFKPNGQITRAEFAAIASKFGDHAGEAGAAFSDIDGHWGSSLIDAVAGKGWVSGYTDGTFKPNQKVTRAEAMAIVNNVLQRIPQDLHSLLPGMKTWPDNANTSKWYYLTVQEASNSHDYERNADGTESWTRLK